MTKDALIEATAAHADLSKADAKKAIEGFLENVQGALKSGDSITLIGFGTFKVDKRNARTGRNPQTGATIQIAAKNVVKFSPGKALSDSVN